VARGLLDAGRDTRLALLAGGTGNDLARNLGVPAADIDATLDLVWSRAERRIDVGYVNDVAFINSCGVGFDTAVLEAMARRQGARSHGAYLATALRLLWRYRPNAIAIDDAGAEAYLVAVIGNGARFGGGMHIAPGAVPDDGLLDLVAVRDMPPLARLRTLLRAARGEHLQLPGVVHRRARAFELVFAAPPLFQLDGDLMRSETARLTVRCERARLSVCAASG
jgi:diacylglycerol kinase (ATP)